MTTDKQNDKPLTPAQQRLKDAILDLMAALAPVIQRSK